MSYEIKYENNKMVFPEFHCDCGFTHNEPDMDVYIGNNILKCCAQYIKKRRFGNKAMLIADNITYEIAGKTVEKHLNASGFQITPCILVREHELEPDERALGEILLTMDQDIEFFISVGSGSITDLTRYVAFHTGRPFVAVGTAASMDGYTSVIAPLLFNGLKVNKPSTYPKIIICDIDIMKDAPLPMFISGVGDILGKYIAKADWILGSIINGETYCPTCAELIMTAVEKCVSSIDEIKNRTEQGTWNLIEALILAGITILILGNTRPVASIEHNMAHYWEMMKLMEKQKAPSHGTAVGVGTVYALKFYEKFLETDLSSIDKAKVKQNRLSREERERQMRECYGDSIATSIMKENPEDFLDWDEHERRIDAVLENIRKIRKEMEFLPSAEKIINVMKELGAPTTAQEIGIDDELLYRTLYCSKDYRSRYTVFKTLDELGLLKGFIQEMKEGR